MAARLEIKIGQKFHRMTILREVEPKIKISNGIAKPCRMFECRCDCGNIKVAMLIHLRRGDTKSCGCFKNENIVIDRITHGLRLSPIYHTWHHMIDRCINPKCSNYTNYGGRGIRVCKLWQNSLTAFHKWAMKNGYQKGLELDRKNNNGNYTPSNCRFVTRKVNANNTRRNIIVELDNEKMTLSEACDKLNINRDLIYGRLRCGINFKDAISMKKNAKRKKCNQ